MATTNNRPENANTAPKNAWDQKELGCMWQRVKKDSTDKYLTGVLNLKNIPGFPDQDVPIVVFKNKNKQQDKHPDLRVYLSEKRQSDGQAQATAPSRAPARAPAPVAPPPDLSNDLI